MELNSIDMAQHGRINPQLPLLLYGGGSLDDEHRSTS
jgi:hypothetical protein